MWVRDRTSAELVVGPADQFCQCCCCWGGERVEDLFEQGPRMAATAARERHSVRRPPRHLPPAGQGFGGRTRPQSMSGPVTCCAQLDLADLVLAAVVEARNVRDVVP